MAQRTAPEPDTNAPPLPAISQIYDTKEDFLKAASEAAAARGFKLYVSEGRAASHSAKNTKVELACSKFRIYDGRGGKTRQGGCKFYLTIRRQGEDTAPTAPWKVVSANYVHNHALGPPVAPKAFAPRPRSASPPGKRGGSWQFEPTTISTGGSQRGGARPPSRTGTASWNRNSVAGYVPGSVAGAGSSMPTAQSHAAYGNMGYAPATSMRPPTPTQAGRYSTAGFPSAMQQSTSGYSYGHGQRVGSSAGMHPAAAGADYGGHQQQRYEAYSYPQSASGAASSSRRDPPAVTSAAGSSGEAGLARLLRCIDASFEAFAGWFHWLGASVDTVMQASETELQAFIFNRLGPAVPTVPQHRLQQLYEGLIRLRRGS